MGTVIKQGKTIYGKVIYYNGREFWAGKSYSKTKGLWTLVWGKEK